MIENPMVLPERRFDNQMAYVSPKPKCGCGRIAVYSVYEDKQPHCKLCVYDAIDCDEQILVGRL